MPKFGALKAGGKFKLATWNHKGSQDLLQIEECTLGPKPQNIFAWPTGHWCVKLTLIWKLPINTLEIPRGDFIFLVLITFSESLHKLWNHFSRRFQDQSKSMKFQCSASPLDVSKMEQTTSPILSKGSNATNCTDCNGTLTMIHQVWPPTLSSQKQRGWSAQCLQALVLMAATALYSRSTILETLWN